MARILSEIARLLRIFTDILALVLVVVVLWETIIVVAGVGVVMRVLLMMDRMMVMSGTRVAATSASARTSNSRGMVVYEIIAHTT